MTTIPAISVGIDVAEEAKGLDLVALDQDGRVRFSQGRLTVDQAGDIVCRELRPGIVCIDSPSGWARSGKRRQSERELAAMGISSFPTGPDPGDHPFYRWMRVGIALFERLADDYPLYRGGDPNGSAAEVFPNASAMFLSGRRRAPGETKVAFRRHVLRDCGIDEPALPNLDRVDAALAAVTGLAALDGRWTALGDPAEGLVLLAVPVNRELARSSSAGKPVGAEAGKSLSL